MADIKISALTSVEEVQSTDVVPVVSGSATMKASASQLKDYINGDLDYSDSAVSGSYVTAVSETDGVVAVIREAADTTPTESSTKMVTSGGVYTKFNEHSSEISNLINFNKLRTKHILLVGDSYESTSSYMESFANYLGHGNTFEALSDYTGVTSDGYIFKAAHGGYGFTNNGGGALSGNGFMSLINELISNITNEQKNAIDMIVFCAGINDSFYTLNSTGWHTLETNLAATNTLIRSNFPNADVNFFFLGRIRGTNPSSITWANLYNNIYHMSSYCGIIDWHYITNSEFVLYQADNLIGDDNFHPVSGAGGAIATYMVQGLSTGCCDIRWVDNLDAYKFTPNGTNMTGGSTPIKRRMSNGVTFLEFYGIEGVMANTSYAFSTYVEIGTQNVFYANETIVIPETVMVRYENGNDRPWIMENIWIKFEGYSVYIAPRGNDITGVSSIAFTNITGNNPIQISVDTIKL